MESNGISGNKRGNVTGFLIVILWVDDCRYFGTADLVAEYETVKRYRLVVYG